MSSLTSHTYALLWPKPYLSLFVTIHSYENASTLSSQNRNQPFDTRKIKAKLRMKMDK